MFPSPTFTGTQFILEGGTCNTLASAFLSAIALLNQAYYSELAIVSGIVTGVSSVGGYWAVTVSFTEPNGPYAGDKFFVALDALEDELLHAEYLVLPLNGYVKAGGPANEGGLDEMLDSIKENTQGLYEVVLATCTDAADVVWAERVVDISGLSAKRAIWSALLETDRGPLMACCSGQVTDAETGPGTFYTFGSDAPDMVGSAPLQQVTPMSALVDAVEEITNQDATVSINQNAAAFSIKAKVVATGP